MTLDAAPDVAGALARFERAESTARRSSRARPRRRAVDPARVARAGVVGRRRAPAMGLERWVRDPGTRGAAVPTRFARTSTRGSRRTSARRREKRSEAREAASATHG